MAPDCFGLLLALPRPVPSTPALAPRHPSFLRNSPGNPSLHTRPPPTLHTQAYRALSGVLGGGGPDGRTSKLRAMDAGLLDAVQASIASFPAEAPSHVEAVRTLTIVVSGLDSMGKQRQARCAEAGAIEVIVSSLTVKAGPGGGAPRWAMAARYRALRNLTRNSDELTQRALDAGAQPDWVVAIKKKD